MMWLGCVIDQKKKEVVASASHKEEAWLRLMLEAESYSEPEAKYIIVEDSRIRYEFKKIKRLIGLYTGRVEVQKRVCKKRRKRL
ncbi:MAG: hypothetical protein K2H96_03885 [Muribaculaceae bacterium]|nr:hypothetical protein [Muribaculaceae bacterium]